MLMLILFCLSQTWYVILRIHELMFSVCTVLPDSRETKLGSGNQEASPLADKKTMHRSFKAMSSMKGCPYICFWWCGFLRYLGVIC